MYKLINGETIETLSDDTVGVVDAIITDPPYFLKGAVSCGKTHSNNKKFADYFDPAAELTARNQFKQWFEVFDKHLKENGALLMFASDLGKFLVVEASKGTNFELINDIVWDKNSQGFGYPLMHTYESILMFKRRFDTIKRASKPMTYKNIIKVSPVNYKKKVHPAQKPIEIMKYLISICTEKGDTVLDPFMGSGTTGVACEEMGRNFIGIEYYDKYFDIAKERLRSEKLYGIN